MAPLVKNRGNDLQQLINRTVLLHARQFAEFSQQHFPFHRPGQLNANPLPTLFMKTLLLSLVVMLTAAESRAQFQWQAAAIYKTVLKVATTGDAVTKQTLTGYTIFSPQYSRGIQLLLYPTGQFVVRTNGGLIPAFLEINAKKPLLCLVQAYSPRLGLAVTALAKGSYVNLTLNNQPWQGTKTMSWSGRATNGGILEESSGTLVLDVQETTLSETSSDTVETAATRLYNMLMNQGHTLARDVLY